MIKQLQNQKVFCAVISFNARVIPLLLVAMISFPLAYAGDFGMIASPTTVQQLQVTGVVNEDSGQPLPGVNVVEKGTNNGTTTDASGRFSLNVQNENSVLLFSFIGYATQEVAVGNKTTFNVNLAPDVQALQEVVVVGYGTQEKVNLTGAVGVTSGEALKNRPIANVGEGLQGMVPNLNVNIRNGDPTAPIEFNIRGYESINGGQPLVLVDNVPMDLNRINPNDIDEVADKILKEIHERLTFLMNVGLDYLNLSR